MKAELAWRVGALLLVLGAIFGGVAVYLHWLPCRGSMFSGSVLQGYTYGADFSDGCLRTMDEGFAFLAPLNQTSTAESGWGLLAGFLVAGAWLLVVATQRWSGPTKVVAALPALATGAIALFAVLGGGAELGTGATLLIGVLPDLLAVAAFVVITRNHSLTTRGHLSVLLLLSGTTAFSLLHLLTDYLLMTSVVSDANWDDPPGFGYLTVVVLVLSGAAVVAMSRHPLQPVRRSYRPIPATLEVVVLRPRDGESERMGRPAESGSPAP